jgi:cytochrome P450
VADDEAVAATVPHELHRMRRAALSPYFSKASIRRLEPIIREIVSKLLKRMDSHQKSGEPLPMTVVYKAVTSDIINNYAFGKSGNCMDMEDYNVSFFESVEAIFEASHLSLQFGWLGPLMESLPMALTTKLMPGMAHLFKMQQVIYTPLASALYCLTFGQGWVRQIEEIRKSRDKEAGKNTIFHGLLNSDLPDQEKGTKRLRQEAQLVVLAGQDTTGKAF